MEKSIVKIIEDVPVDNGWSSVRIKCINKNGCDQELLVNILFENGEAQAAMEDDVTCPKCGLVVGLDQRLRLQ
jgi:hypothetical protein